MAAASGRWAVIAPPRPLNEMHKLVFFYGTLMTPFNRTGLLGIAPHLVYRGRGTIAAALSTLASTPQPCRTPTDSSGGRCTR